MSIELPEHLRTGPLAEAAAKALADAQSMASASNSVPRISLRGREFRLVENGEEVKKIRDQLDVIILGVEPEAGRMIKTFYKDGYKSGAKEPPTCSSDDGISPAPWVNERQADSCQKCPKNAFGSATSPTGKPTKACRDSKRVWVVLAQDEKPISDRTMYGLNVSVASLKSFSDHGRKLAALGQGPAVAITRLVMQDLEYPQLEFQLIGWLDADSAPQSLKIAAAKPWKINYGSAGLALAMNESAGKASALPMSAPPVPARLQPAAAATTNQGQVSSTPTNIDDEVAKW